MRRDRLRAIDTEMGCLERCIWPLITLAVIVVAVLVYFLFPPVCRSPEPANHVSTGSSSPQVPPPAPSAPEHQRPWEANDRIPKTTYPLSYILLVHPDLNTGLFSGTVQVLVNVTQRTDHLLLNIDGLNVTDTRVSTTGGAPVKLRSTLGYRPNQFWVMLPQDALEPGLYHLDLKYRGSMMGDIVGLYMSEYLDSATNRTRKIATTKFEPTFARRAFPCFDEPSFKARFNVSLVRPSSGNYIALSNMNQVGEDVNSPSQGLTTVHFATSMLMSSYLACFIVCDFEHLPPKQSKNGFNVTVYARRGQTQKMQYALDIAASTIDFYIDYFGINYPLPKLDLIAIPDFVSGAMENWGLITFRETSVLYDSEFSSSSNHLGVTLTTTHELAHMWFGDLVTMKWWDDLWLNEGFATFIEFKGTAHNHPDWDLDTIFITHDLSDALSLDATLSSHPIINHVSHPDQINEIFDRVSYAKGASVIRMLEGFMGADKFREGVVSYLKTYEFSNAETNDLWQHLQKFSQPGVDVQRVMDTWTRQMGYPVLNVVKSGQDTITVTQQRFTLDKNASYNANDSLYRYKWDVPVTFVTSEKSQPTLEWLLMENKSLTLKVGDVQWYKLNHHFTGFYRVNYPPEHWTMLTNLLRNDLKALSAADRTNLISDAFSLAEGGLLDYGLALSVTGFLRYEDHFVVWSIASSHLLGIDTHLQFTPAYSDFRKYLKKLIEPQISDDLWDFPPDDSFLQRSLQSQLLALSCRVGIPACLNKAKQLFTDWLMHNGTTPNVEIRSLVYYYGMGESGEEEWDKLWTRYLDETDPQEKVRLQGALSNVKEPWILSRFIERAKNEDYVRSQDFFSVLASIARNPVGNGLLWDWLRANWQYLVDRFTLNNRSFGRILPAVVGTYSTEVKLKEVEEFLEQYPEVGAGGAGRKSAIEVIKLNISWLKEHLATLTNWLKKQ